jgi:ribosomal protein L40E
MADRSALIPKAVNLAMERLGDSTICQRCGATAKTMGDVCKAVGADLAELCEGFNAYDTARTQALHDVGFFKRGRHG